MKIYQKQEMNDFVGDDKADGTKKLKHLTPQYCAISYIIA